LLSYIAPSGALMINSCIHDSQRNHMTPGGHALESPAICRTICWELEAHVYHSC